MHGVSRMFAEFGPDVLPQAQNVAGCAHPHQIPIIEDAVKAGRNLHSALAEHRPHIQGNFYIGSVDVRDF